MVLGRGSSARGGGQIGHGTTARDDDAYEKEEQRKRVSDAARIRGSYRYLIHGRTPPPAFSRRESLEKVAALIEEKGAGLAPGDFVDDAHLPCVIALVSENSRRDADKKEEWRREAEEQRKAFVDLDTDEEE